MSLLESPPKIKEEVMVDVLRTQPSEDIAALVDKINEGYEYWDAVKYKKRPQNCSAEKLWTYVKVSRMKNMHHESDATDLS